MSSKGEKGFFKNNSMDDNVDKRYVDSQLADITKQQKLYKNKNQLRPYLLESFKNSADFTTTRCSVTQDTTNFLTGTSAIKATSTDNSGYSAIKKTVTWDLNDADDFEIEVYIADTSNITQFYLYFFTTSSDYASAIVNVFNKGWNTFRFSKAEFAITGSFSWSNITSFQVNFYSVAGQFAVIGIDSLKKNVKDTPQLIFVFDDGFSSAYTEAFAYLKSKGYKGCAAINKNNIGKAGYVTVAQLQEMYNCGWDILNHSTTHPDFTTLTYTQVAYEIQDTQTWLYNNGFVRGNDIMIYPKNYSDIGKQVCKDLGFKVARGLTGRINYAQSDDILNLKSIVPNNTSTIDNTVTKYLDRMLVTGGTAILTIHDLKETPTISTEVAISLFRGIVDYCTTNNLKVITFSEWYDSLFN